MKTDKYKDHIKREIVEVDDNIKMEVPDEIVTDMAKINLEKKVNTEVCHVCAKEFRGRLSLLQHMKVHVKEFSINVTSAITKLQQKKVSERSH